MCFFLKCYLHFRRIQRKRYQLDRNRVQGVYAAVVIFKIVSRFLAPLVLFAHLRFFFRRKVVHDIKCLPNFLWCFALDHTRDGCTC